MAAIGLWAALCGVCLASSSSARSQSGAADDPAARWQRMDAERRAEMQRRFEQFRSLDDEQREALRERAHQLRAERDRLRDDLTPDERARLEGLDPSERDEVLRHHHESVARARGERMLGLLPPPVIEQLEGVHPADRPQVLHHWRDDFHARHLGRALKRTAKELGLERSEVDAILAGPPEAQAQALREWTGRLGGDRPPWAGRGPVPVVGPLADDPELLRELRKLAHPTLEDDLAVEGLERHERMRAVDQRIATRLLDRLGRSDRLSPEQLEALRAMGPKDLVRAMRGGHDRRRGGDEGRRGDGPDRGRRSDHGSRGGESDGRWPGFEGWDGERRERWPGAEGRDGEQDGRWPGDRSAQDPRSREGRHDGRASEGGRPQPGAGPPPPVDGERRPGGPGKRRGDQEPVDPGDQRDSRRPR